MTFGCRLRTISIFTLQISCNSFCELLHLENIFAVPQLFLNFNSVESIMQLAAAIIIFVFVRSFGDKFRFTIIRTNLVI